MTNKELKEFLSQYPDEIDIRVGYRLSMGDHELPGTVIVEYVTPKPYINIVNIISRNTNADQQKRLRDKPEIQRGGK